MKIVECPIKDIQPYPANAKAHPDSQVKQIVNSIKEFGFNQPIVVDTKGVIIVGHGRYLAAHLLGLENVPVLEVNLTEEQARAYRLADNKLNESEWDMEVVISELKELSLPMIELTGFSKDLIIGSDDKDDVIPDVPKQPKSKLGDVYILGKHKIVVGDSTILNTYSNLVESQTVDMVFTDPPYNVNYKGQGKDTNRTIENDNMDDFAFDSFLSEFFQSAAQFVKSGAGWYVFHSSSTQDQFKKALESSGLEVRSQLIWNKPTSALGWGDYRWKHEPFFYAGKKDSKIVFYGDRTHGTVIDFHSDEKSIIAWVKREKKIESMGMSTIWSMKRADTRNYKHPTQKPVELICYAIANSSKEGDLVLDPFLGSGSTLIACQKMNRICYGVELDPTFADVIVQRYVDFLGIPQEIIKNGKIEVWNPNIKMSLPETDLSGVSDNKLLN